MSINIPVVKARHLTKPVISRTRKYAVSTLMGGTGNPYCRGYPVLTGEEMKDDEKESITKNFSLRSSGSCMQDGWKGR